MRLWHTTVADRLPSIRRRGLLTSKSEGKRRAVWLHVEDRRSWAFLHVVARHGGDVRDVVSIEVDVPDDLVKRSAVSGLYYVTSDLSPGTFRQLVTFEQQSRSPLQRMVRRGK